PALLFTARRLCQKGQFIRRGRGPSRNEMAPNCCTTITSKGQGNTRTPRRVRGSSGQHTLAVGLRAFGPSADRSPDFQRRSYDWGCGVVRSCCCDGAAPKAAVFKLSAAPLLPPNPAIACTS